MSAHGEHIIMVEMGAKLVSEEEMVRRIELPKSIGTLVKTQLILLNNLESKSPTNYSEANEQVMRKLKELLSESKMDEAI